MISIHGIHTAGVRNQYTLIRNTPRGPLMIPMPLSSRTDGSDTDRDPRLWDARMILSKRRSGGRSPECWRNARCRFNDCDRGPAPTRVRRWGEDGGRGTPRGVGRRGASCTHHLGVPTRLLSYLLPSPTATMTVRKLYDRRINTAHGGGNA